MIQKQTCSTPQEHQRSFSKYKLFANVSLFSLRVPCKYIVYCNIWIGQILPRLQPIMDFYSPVLINLDAATTNPLFGSLLKNSQLMPTRKVRVNNLAPRHHEHSLTCERRWKAWRPPGRRPRKAFTHSRGEQQR